MEQDRKSLELWLQKTQEQIDERLDMPNSCMNNLSWESLYRIKKEILRKLNDGEITSEEALKQLQGED